MADRVIPVAGVRLFGFSVLVEKMERTLKYGLILPDSVKEGGGKDDTLNMCRVRNLGDGKVVGKDGQWITIPLRLDVGDMVVIDPRFVRAVKIDGKKYGIVEEEHILLVVQPGTEAM